MIRTGLRGIRTAEPRQGWQRLYCGASLRPGPGRYGTWVVRWEVGGDGPVGTGSPGGSPARDAAKRETCKVCRIAVWSCQGGRALAEGRLLLQSGMDAVSSLWARCGKDAAAGLFSCRKAAVRTVAAAKLDRLRIAAPAVVSSNQAASRSGKSAGPCRQRIWSSASSAIRFIDARRCSRAAWPAADVAAPACTEIPAPIFTPCWQ